MPRTRKTPSADKDHAGDRQQHAERPTSAVPPPSITANGSRARTVRTPDAGYAQPARPATGTSISNFAPNSDDARKSTVAEFAPKSATFGAMSVAVVRGETGDAVHFWQSKSECILPSWMYRITGWQSRCSACLTHWRLTTGTRLGPRSSSCGGQACMSLRFWSWNGGTWTTRGYRRRSWSGSRRAGGLGR